MRHLVLQGLFVGAVFFGCSGSTPAEAPSSGDASGGVGGSPNSSGGQTGSALPNSGGSGTGGSGTVLVTGGTPAAGGGSATGGNANGGAAPTGGSQPTGGRANGGSAPIGGSLTTGGTAAGGGSPRPVGGGSQGGATAKGGGAQGGKATGGAAPAGGAGGVVPTGGTKATGGTASVAGGSSVTGGTTFTGTSACGSGTSTSSDIVVNLGSLQQKITGFGVSSAWAGSYRNASDADYLWSTTKGAGLTLLRIRYGDGLAIAKSAASMGATVWMTPWGMGSNGAQGGPYTTQQSNPNGCSGSMPVLSDPQGWANQLSTWVQNAKTQGVPLFAVSAENEPDSCGINSTTSYSADQLAAWIPYLSAAMKPLNIKVMAPETMNRCGFDTYFKAIKASTAAWDAVDIFASHEYGCGTLTTDASIAAAGKEYWETEVDTGKASGDSTGDGIASALLMATTMHNDLTKPNVNAWHIWWLYNASGNGGELYDTTTNVWTKRLWVLGNYSRYVRPGYKRAATSGTQPSGVYVSAYTNPADGTVSIVAINTGTSAANVSLFITGAAPCSMTPYVTSGTDNLAAQTAITVSGSRFTASLASQSVTTFVGTP
jgi:glucuronoarabinoxylan endo-1,4-beta-xylanase